MNNIPKKTFDRLVRLIKKQFPDYAIATEHHDEESADIAFYLGPPEEFDIELAICSFDVDTEGLHFTAWIPGEKYRNHHVEQL